MRERERDNKLIMNTEVEVVQESDRLLQVCISCVVRIIIISLIRHE